MNVTRDVINDLLPLYLAGEASQDTQALVQDFLKDDPAFAALVKQDQALTDAPAVPGVVTQEQELKTLAQIQRLLRRRSWYLALAVLFTGVTGICGGGPEGVWWLWQDTVWVAVVLALVAAIFWAAYVRLRRQLKASGL